MGSTVFMIVGGAKTAEVAFTKLVKEAQHHHGHGGYTGTIAEKRSFVMIHPISSPVNLKGTIEEKLAVAQEHARNLINKSDPRIDDKWGPAGCIQISKSKFLFFGWASE